MKITVADVAAAAGVGESTVSRVLRNEGSFSEKTRNRVVVAADRLGYVPNRIAGSLASARSRLVAVAVPSLSNIVFADVLRGAGEVLEPLGFQSVFGLTEYDTTKEEILVESFLQYRPTAILLSGTEHSDRTISILRNADCKVVEMLDTDAPNFAAGVGFSNVAAGTLAGRHLLSLGYRRIAYAGHDLDHDLRAAKRLRGFNEALAEKGIRPLMTLTVAQPSSVLLGAQLTEEICRAADVEAIYFANDDLAMGGYFHALKAGIDVPGGLGLMGHNGLDIGAALPRRLTTIRTRRAEMGRIAARMAISDEEPGFAEVDFELIEGETTTRIKS